MPLEYGELRESLLEAMRSTLSFGAAVAEMSSLSCADRALGVFVVRPTGTPLAELRSADLPVLSLTDGHVVAANTSPAADATVHLILYRHLQNIRSIAHVRSAYATAWAQAGRDIPVLGSAHAQWFHGPVPAIRLCAEPSDASAEDTRIGASIIRWFSENAADPISRPAVLVESHGAYTWGSSLAETLRIAAALETIAQMAAWSLFLQPKILPISDNRIHALYLRSRRPCG